MGRALFKKGKSNVCNGKRKFKGINQGLPQTGKQGGIMRSRFTYIILLFLLFSLADKSRTSNLDDDRKINDFCRMDCFVRKDSATNGYERTQKPAKETSKERLLFNAVICLADNELNRHCYLQLENAGMDLNNEGKSPGRAPKQL
jgi:hypothetical protein